MKVENKQDNKKYEQIKEKLNEEINKISEKIQKKTNTQSLLLQYDKYNNNSHIPVGVISLFAITFVATRIINIDIPNTIMIGLISSATLSLGTKIFFKKKQDNMKKANPNVDFINYNIDDNYKEIENLFNRKFELVDKLNKENEKILDEIEEKQKKEFTQIPENYINYDIEQKAKVKTLKRM